MGARNKEDGSKLFLGLSLQLQYNYCHVKCGFNEKSVIKGVPGQRVLLGPRCHFLCRRMIAARNTETCFCCQ